MPDTEFVEGPGGGPLVASFAAAVSASDADAQANFANVLAAIVHAAVYNGATWDRWEGSQLGSGALAQTGVGLVLATMNDAGVLRALMAAGNIADIGQGHNNLAIADYIFDRGTANWIRASAVSSVADGLGVQQAMQPSSTPFNDTAIANTAVTRTFAAVAGQAHRLTQLITSYSAVPTSGRITVQDGATTIYDADITVAGELNRALPAAGIKGTVGNAMTVTLAAGGAAVVGKLNTAKLTA